MKSFAAALCFVFTINVVLANYSEANFWNERRKAVQQTKNQSRNPFQLASLPGSSPYSKTTQILNHLQLPSLHLFPSAISNQIEGTLPLGSIRKFSSILSSLASSYGSVRKISAPESAQPNKVIIPIQDVHLNSEAQANIGKTVQKLIDDNKIDLIALEGAFTPIDLSGFRNFPDHEPIRKVADYFLKGNQISGPVHTALTSSTDIPAVVGVDDPAHYQLNVDAYKQSAALVKEYKRRLSDIENKLAEKKSFRDHHILWVRTVRTPLEDWWRGSV